MLSILKVNLMNSNSPQKMFETTADKIGLVCRTKVELYYFLATSSKNLHLDESVQSSLENKSKPNILLIYFIDHCIGPNNH